MSVAHTVVDIPLERLRVSPTNPRKANPALLGEGYTALTKLIAAHGVLNPLIVVASGDGYEVICGFRRYTSARRVGLKTLPCIVRELTLLEQLEVGLIDNLNRQRLDPVDVGHALLALVEQGLSQYTIAERIGRSQSYVSRHLLLTELPASTQKKIKAKKLTVDAALGYGQAPAKSVFEVDADLHRSWTRLREAALGTGNRALLNAMSDFAKSWKEFQAVARQERRTA